MAGTASDAPVSAPGRELRPGMVSYLDSLSEDHRQAAMQRLAALPAEDVLGLGVTEPHYDEHDYLVEETQGTLPDGLAGALYRNGPGRWEDYTHRPLLHLFDGDGMVSKFTVGEGEVRYRNRYVRTNHYRGRGGTTHVGTPAAGGRLDTLRHPMPANLANTNIVEHAGRLYALWEGGPPHELDPDTLETLGRRRLGGELRWMGSYSAHPSICPDSGEMYNFGVELFPRPHLRIYATDPAGRLRHFDSVRLPYPAMVHDGALTESHLVFLVSPLMPDVLPLALGTGSIAGGLRYRPDKGSFVILVSRDGHQTRIFEADPFLLFHISNAYDCGSDVVVDAVTYSDGAILSSIADFRSRTLTGAPSELTRFTVSRTGQVRRDRISDTNCEFPRHHPLFEGKQHRYSYVSSRVRLGAFYDAITKVDLQSQTEQTYLTPVPGSSFCEPVFTGRPGAESEDDGWLLTVEYQADVHRSRLVVFDARDVTAGPVFCAQLSHHVPQGFHGNFYPS